MVAETFLLFFAINLPDQQPVVVDILRHTTGTHCEKIERNWILQVITSEMSQANALIEAKTLTISKLMTIMPQGTVDPSPFIYNNTMYTMAGLVGVASALHFMVKPVDKKHFEKTE